ncbi:MAG: ribonuclease HII [Proteobacteria bacterium]|nr:ribonuclease HII [Pseudomonadota bacterium]
MQSSRSCGKIQVMKQSRSFKSSKLLAGVDEAGRGPLAGPVVAAAVILNPEVPISGLADSKKLSAKRREELAQHIRRRALAWSVAWADPAEIDVLNVLAATMLAMRRAIIGLAIVPDYVQVDGNRLPCLNFDNTCIAGEAIVGGDNCVTAISAASIIAKTTRDKMMVAMDRIYPLYDFASHKGYGTEVHRERLQEFGPCREHRFTFAPVRAVS